MYGEGRGSSPPDPEDGECRHDSGRGQPLGRLRSGQRGTQIVVGHRSGEQVALALVALSRACSRRRWPVTSPSGTTVGSFPGDRRPPLADGWYRPPPVVTLSWGAVIDAIPVAAIVCQLETRGKGLTRRFSGRWAVPAGARGDLEARFHGWHRQWEERHRTEGALISRLRDGAAEQIRLKAAELDA
jgi:hypothetical protein